MLLYSFFKLSKKKNRRLGEHFYHLRKYVRVEEIVLQIQCMGEQHTSDTCFSS